MWAYSPKIAKSRNFWYLFTPMEKFWGFTEKVGYRCTTTNLPLCNGAILFLKITLLHSVSVIRIFVIRKGDKKQTNLKCITSAGQCNTDRPLERFLSDFCKSRRGGACSRTVASCQTSRLWL